MVCHPSTMSRRRRRTKNTLSHHAAHPPENRPLANVNTRSQVHAVFGWQIHGERARMPTLRQRYKMASSRRLGRTLGGLRWMTGSTDPCVCVCVLARWPGAPVREKLSIKCTMYITYTRTEHARGRSRVDGWVRFMCVCVYSVIMCS